MENYLLEMKDIAKIYGNGIVANEAVNFNLKKGEVHALVGENGAGKSTLMKILFGMEAPSSGTVTLKGEPVRFSSSKDAIAHGIGMVHQHFMLVESFTAAQNIILGMEPKKGFSVNEEEAVRFTEEISKKYNLEVDARAVTRTLPVGIKQKIEILKALARGAEILILDEPTAGLDVVARDELLELLRAFMEQDEDRGILISSHISGDLETLCDDIHMLHNGKIILHEDTDVLLDDYAVLKVDEQQYRTIEKRYILRCRKESFGYSCLTNQKRFYMENYPKLAVLKGSIDEVIMMMIRGEAL